MHTKLTLRLDHSSISRAKHAARKRGKSVSQMVAEFFDSLESREPPKAVYPPVTSSLLGLLKGASVSREDYRRHLRDKHL